MNEVIWLYYFMDVLGSAKGAAIAFSILISICYCIGFIIWDASIKNDESKFKHGVFGLMFSVSVFLSVIIPSSEVRTAIVASKAITVFAATTEYQEIKGEAREIIDAIKSHFIGKEKE